MPWAPPEANAERRVRRSSRRAWSGGRPRTTDPARRSRAQGTEYPAELGPEHVRALEELIRRKLGELGEGETTGIKFYAIIPCNGSKPPAPLEHSFENHVGEIAAREGGEIDHVVERTPQTHVIKKAGVK